MTPYYRTEQGTNSTYLVLVCAWVYPNTLPSVLAGGRGWSPRTADVSSPLRPAKPRSGRGLLYSSGRVAHHGAGTLSSAKSGVPGWACGTDATIGPSSGHGPGVRERQFMSRSSVWGDSYHVVGSERDDSTAWGQISGDARFGCRRIASGWPHHSTPRGL